MKWVLILRNVKNNAKNISKTLRRYRQEILWALLLVACHWQVQVRARLYRGWVRLPEVLAIFLVSGRHGTPARRYIDFRVDPDKAISRG